MSNRAAREIAALFNGVDERLADHLEHGAAERLYFVATELPRIDDTDGQMTHAVRTRYVPSTPHNQPELLRLARELRPPRGPTDLPAGARTSRGELTAAIGHRPQSRARAIEPWTPHQELW